MLSEKMQGALNDQINAEMYSSYLYLSMSAYFDSINLKGCAAWMLVQSQEETVHAMKILRYIQERGVRIRLKAIDAQQEEWDSPLAAFEAAYGHEQKVTGLINDLVTLANKENDYATNAMLQWFVEEQVEEEASVDEVVQKLKLVADAPGGLFMVDTELGARTFTPAAPAEGG